MPKRKAMWSHPDGWESCAICGTDMGHRTKTVLMKMTGVEWSRVHVCAKCVRAIYTLVNRSYEYGVETWEK